MTHMDPKQVDPRAIGSTIKKARANCEEIIRYWGERGYTVSARPVPAAARGRFLIETDLVNGAPAGHIAAIAARQKVIDMNRTRQRSY